MAEFSGKRYKVGDGYGKKRGKIVKVVVIANQQRKRRMRSHRIRIKVGITDCEEDVSKEERPQRLGDGEFELRVSGAVASSIDDCEEALLKTNYPALRDALGKHLAEVSKEDAGRRCRRSESQSDPLLSGRRERLFPLHDLSARGRGSGGV